MANQVDSLNTLLMDELAAVETYNMALDKAKSPNVISVLSDCKECHAKRSVRLSELVASAGGTPKESSGAWGAFAKMVEGGATILGEGPAIGSLQEGEDHGIESYNTEMKNLDGEILAIVQGELFPAQERTQKALANLKPQ